VGGMRGCVSECDEEAAELLAVEEHFDKSVRASQQGLKLRVASRCTTTRITLEWWVAAPKVMHAKCATCELC
jgi:hypothetical protein